LHKAHDAGFQKHAQQFLKEACGALLQERSVRLEQ